MTMLELFTMIFIYVGSPCSRNVSRECRVVVATSDLVRGTERGVAKEMKSYFCFLPALTESQLSRFTRRCLCELSAVLEVHSDHDLQVGVVIFKDTRRHSLFEFPVPID